MAKSQNCNKFDCRFNGRESEWVRDRANRIDWYSHTVTLVHTNIDIHIRTAREWERTIFFFSCIETKRNQALISEFVYFYRPRTNTHKNIKIDAINRHHFFFHKFKYIFSIEQTTLFFFAFDAFCLFYTLCVIQDYVFAADFCASWEKKSFSIFFSVFRFTNLFPHK